MFRTLSLNCDDPNKSGACSIATPRLRGFQELCFLSVSAWKTTSQLHPHMAERFQGPWPYVNGSNWRWVVIASASQCVCVCMCLGAVCVCARVCVCPLCLHTVSSSLGSPNCWQFLIRHFITVRAAEANLLEVAFHSSLPPEWTFNVGLEYLNKKEGMLTWKREEFRVPP